MEILLCFVCDHKSAYYLKNLSSIRSKHSRAPIFDFIKRFLNSELPDRLNSENTVVCVECLNKIDEYDLACLTVKRVEQELREILLHTESRYQQAAEVAAANQLFECIDVATIDVIKYESDLSNNDKDTVNNDKSTSNINNALRGTIGEIMDTLFSQSKLSDSSDVGLEKSKPRLMNTFSQKRTKLPYKCSTCFAAFSNASHLEIHKRKHIKSVKRSRTLATTALVERKTETVVREAKWDEITTESSKEAKLLAQNQPHPSYIPTYRCIICGIESKDETKWKEHNDLHQNVPPLQCVTCYKILSNKGCLIRHMRIHAGIILHQCDICGKEFIHETSIKMHMMAHANIRDKECLHCLRRFRSTSVLNRHIFTHTGEKPYSCPECGQKFAREFNMRVHRQQHNTIKTAVVKMHNCTICELSFDRPSKLGQHYLRVHEILLPQTTSLFQSSTEEKKNCC